MRRNTIVKALCCLTFLVSSVVYSIAADENVDPSGRPEKFKAGKGKTYAVYEEDGTWHIRMTSKEGKGRVGFTGAVRVTGDKISGDFQGLEKAKQAKDADWISVDQDGQGFKFQFALFGKVDAANFKVGPKAESISFNLQVAGDDDPKLILIGKKGEHPAKAQFSLSTKLLKATSKSPGK